jgi:hypothetical protein
LDVPELATAARTAFVDGMHAGVLVAAGAALLGALFTALWLPARARDVPPGAPDARSEAEPAPVAPAPPG